MSAFESARELQDAVAQGCRLLPDSPSLLQAESTLNGVLQPMGYGADQANSSIKHSDTEEGLSTDD